eukprot:SAG31_NODE_1448_length_8310_cov_6.709171_6_plen_74_part_00
MCGGSNEAAEGKEMASPSEKAEKLRDFAAKGNLEGVESMVRDSLDDIIWWINEGNNVHRKLFARVVQHLQGSF